MHKSIRFILGVVVVILIFIFLPLIHSLLPGSTKFKHKIEDENIKVSALFYSEEPKTAGLIWEVEDKLK